MFAIHLALKCVLSILCRMFAMATPSEMSAGDDSGSEKHDDVQDSRASVRDREELICKMGGKWSILCL